MIVGQLSQPEQQGLHQFFEQAYAYKQQQDQIELENQQLNQPQQVQQIALWKIIKRFIIFIQKILAELQNLEINHFSKICFRITNCFVYFITDF